MTRAKHGFVCDDNLVLRLRVTPTTFVSVCGYNGEKSELINVLEELEFCSGTMVCAEDTFNVLF